jgi:hypothetical protein
LLSAPISDLAVLGPGAAVAIGSLRQAIRRVASLAGDRDEAAELQLGVTVLEAARAARAAEAVLTMHYSKGPAAADRLRIVPSSSAPMPALEAPLPARLLPAA